MKLCIVCKVKTYDNDRDIIPASHIQSWPFKGDSIEIHLLSYGDSLSWEKAMSMILRQMYHNLRQRFLGDYRTELDKAVGDCRTLLDVGCGSSSPIKSFSKRLFCVGVDAFRPAIEKSKKEKIHNEYVVLDALNLEQDFERNSFDCVLACDLIEHLKKEDGLRLLRMMERIARKRVIIFTPNGFLKQREYDNNPWQTHKSGWTVDEMRSLGYRVIGINGWKPLRGEHASARFHRNRFWNKISDMTEFFVRNHPEKAFQLLCVKYKGRS